MMSFRSDIDRRHALDKADGLTRLEQSTVVLRNPLVSATCKVTRLLRVETALQG